ncbi:protein RRP5 homolog isoform X2 [Pristis pectinata]|uniref:protein RRP5 homolog isoform X2 n=1 Tax=Pristis pectinata TaxID=685728 RepID=UPI00223CD420|nr:protein RRP5 homolog isoform X2 [Pristis pectinata]
MRVRVSGSIGWAARSISGGRSHGDVHALTVAAMDEDFPRGGIQRKPTAGKNKNEEQDNLFQLSGSEHRTKNPKVEQRKKEINNEKTKKPRELQGRASREKQPKEEGILTFKKLNVGTLLLGCVKEVTDFELAIGLPHGLTGYVSLTGICDALTQSLSEQVNEDLSEDLTALPDLYSPGMVVRCVISQLGATKTNRHSLKLSINPKEVNAALSAGTLRAGMLLSGCVSSVEDHGYLVDIGVKITKAFLSQQKAQEYIKNRNQGLPLRVGQYLNFLLESVKDNGRFVQLSVRSTDVATAMATDDQNWGLCNLLPGLVVNAEVQKVNPHSLVLQFLSGVLGTVDFRHLDPQKIGTYHTGQKVKACVLYVQPDSKSVHLTLRPIFLQPGALVRQPGRQSIGEVLEQCTVLCYHKGAGVTFRLEDGSFAYSRVFHLSDTKMTSAANVFRKGTKHRCRVIDYAPMEQMALVSLKKTIIEAPFLRYHDILPGQMIEGKVASLEKFGVLVKVTDHIRGLVPRTHLADVPLKHPEKMYSVGDKIKCRVLRVNAETKKVTLTRKKTLVKSKLPVISCYSEAVPGQTAHGYIVCVKPFGCIVCFYGDVRGLVPRHELSVEPPPFPEKVFYVGQVVKATVLKCNPNQEKLLLSLKPHCDAIGREPGTRADDAAQEREGAAGYPTGKIVDVKVLAKAKDGLEVSILPEQVAAFLPTTHLSDHVSNCRLLAERLRVGDVISGVMCWSQAINRIILSRKPALLAFVEQGVVAKDFTELQVGMVMTGMVKNIMPYGVFVEFAHGLVGLAPKAAMSDKFVTNTVDHFVMGQTVVAMVTNLDEEKRRALLTLKVSDCGSGDADRESLALLSQYLMELDFIRSFMGRRDSPVVANLSRLVIGQRLELTVDAVKTDGTMHFTGKDVAGLTVTASRYHQGEAPVSPGQQLAAVVLFVDLLSSTVYVSVRPELLCARVKKLKGVSQQSAVVQFVASDVAVASLCGSSQLTFTPVASHLNDTFHFDSEKLSEGQTVSVKLKASGKEHQGIPLSSRGPSKHRRPNQDHEPLEAVEEAAPELQHTLCVGDIVSGTVKSVRPTSLFIALPGGVTGFVHASEILERVSDGTVPTSSQKVGNTVTAKVIGGKETKSHKFLPITHSRFTVNKPVLTLRPSKLSEKHAAVPQDEELVDRLRAFKRGQVLTCYVYRYYSAKQCLDVEVTHDIHGNVEQLLLTLNHKCMKHPERMFQPGQALTATVISPDSTGTRLCLSLTGLCSLDEGAVTLGTIKKVLPSIGVLVSLPFGKTGRAGLCDLADSYSESPLEGLVQGSLIRCCVISKDKNQLGISLRKSRVYPEKKLPVCDPEITSIKDLWKGAILRGYIKDFGELGVFVSLSATLTGHVQYQHVTDYSVNDNRLYQENIPKGKLVTVKVLSTKDQAGYVGLSLLPQDTRKPDLLPASLGLLCKELNETKMEVAKAGKRKRRDSEREQLPPKKLKTQKKQRLEEGDCGLEVYCREADEESDADIEQLSPVKPKVPRLQLSTSFAWGASLNTIAPVTKGHKDMSSDSEEEQSTDTEPRLSRREKEASKRRAEKELARVEQQLTDPARHPQTADDFDRLVLGSPNSSIIWMQYMVFHLHATEIEKARAVAERALKTISFREEQEKLNIWVALLNLENLYGTEESLTKVFERAVQYNDPLKVFQQLASVYTRSEKYKQADALYNTMLKRFRQESAVWLSYATFLLKQGRGEGSRALLERALKCLPKKEHVDVITKFAQLEFRLGDRERAKAMFESTLSSYPKRTDLWSIYIDLVVKYGSQEEVRHLLDRAVHLKAAPKKIKFFFKRYLAYEKEHGSAERVQAVKEMALAYVDSRTSLEGS